MIIKIGRHGHVNHLNEDEMSGIKEYPDLALTTEGWCNVWEIPGKIKEFWPFHGISSPALRAKQSIAPLAETFQFFPLVFPGLRPLEITNIEKITEAIREHNANGKNWTQAWFKRDIGIERPEKFYARTATTLRIIIKRSPITAKIFLSAHLETIWAANSFFQGKPFSEEICDLNLPFCHIASYRC